MYVTGLEAKFVKSGSLPHSKVSDEAAEEYVWHLSSSEVIMNTTDHFYFAKLKN